MKKALIIALISVLLVFASGMVYLNLVFLPNKAKGLIIKSIEDATQKKASLSSVRVNIFKGIVLKDLVIYDSQGQIVNVKEASCIFWFLGLMQKKIVIPSVKFNSAVVFIERRKDNSFNLGELFVPKQDAALKAALTPALPQPVKQVPAAAKPSSGFAIEVYRISLRDSLIRFRDESIKDGFSLDLRDVDLNIYLSLPGSIKFKGSLQSPGNLKPNIYLNGEFKAPQNYLNANLIIKNIQPAIFQPYYLSSGIQAGEGAVDATLSLGLKDNLLDLQGALKASRVSLNKDGLAFLLNSDASFNIRYALAENKAQCRGRALVVDTAISGIEYLGPISIKKATVDFSETEASSGDISAVIFNRPVDAKLILSNFDDLKIHAELTSSFDLSLAQELLMNKLGFTLPGKSTGDASLYLNILMESLSTRKVRLAGLINILGGSLKLDRLTDPLEDINGKLEFTMDQLKAEGLAFSYLKELYKLSFLVQDFQSPVVSLQASSDNLLLSTDFRVNKSNIDINNLSGKYYNSDFRAEGDFDAKSFSASIRGSSAVNLDDLGKIFVKARGQLEKIKPKGKINLEFSLSGDTKDIKGCQIQANASSPQISLYGLKGEGLSFHYRQQGGIGEVPLSDFSFYGGKASLWGKANLRSDDFAYSAFLALEGVKIEELKLDTQARNKDVAGTVNGNVKLSGFSNDLSRLSATGSLDITKGRLWELDLFKGMGKLLFARDFANIVFSEGSCSFSIRDKYIVSEDIVLKSNIASLSGRARIGFDNSIDAALNIDILDEFVPLSGTFKDVTTTVIGRSGKFATINITGTLKEPKYRFKTAVENIIKGITNTLKQAIRGGPPAE